MKRISVGPASGKIDLSNNGTATKLSDIVRQSQHSKRIPINNVPEHRSAPHITEQQEKQREARDTQRSGIVEYLANRNLLNLNAKNVGVLTDVKEHDGHLADTNSEDFTTSMPIEPKATQAPLSGSYRARTTEPMAKNLGEHAQRIEFPSHYVFYSFETCTARPLNFADLVTLHAAKVSNDESSIIDVLDGTISVDIRDLTEKDFRYFLYWHRLNSYLTIPYKFTWKSLYGNENEFTVTKAGLSIKVLEKIKDDLDEYPMFTVPTIRDMEEYRTTLAVYIAENKNSESFRYSFSKARYCHGNSLIEKTNSANALDLGSLYSLLPKFVEEFDDYGVNESFETKDAKFEPLAAIKYLEDKLAKVELYIESLLEAEDTQESSELADPMEIRQTLIAEIARINSELSNTGEAAPQRETRAFQIDLNAFFPSV